MKKFAELINSIASSGKTNDKLDVIQEYFASANDKDKVWVIALFSGRKPKRAVSSRQLATWCIELANIPSWLFEECYHTTGDLAETIALLLPEKNIEGSPNYSLAHYMEILGEIEKKSIDIKREFIINAWQAMDQNEKFVFNKLITGSFRIGISQKSIVNAIAKIVGLSPSIIAHRISGNWNPLLISFKELLSLDNSTDNSKPYPFYLAYPIEETPDKLGSTDQWQAEWKWDGIRGQIIKRNGEIFIWSRGEELITDKFPEFDSLKNLLPDGSVLDGEILPFNGTSPLSFNVLQTRIGRKNVTKKQLTEAPVVFFAYDLLESEGIDIRDLSLEDRRKQLEKIVELINQPVLRLSIVIHFDTWEQLVSIRDKAREVGSEGLMIKRKKSFYKVGRKKGDWWKWKIDPLTIDAVMIYAQKGHGRRSNLYTDYTFAVRDNEQLISFAKAYSGLTDKEIAQVDAFVKRNSIEKFGPVRTVKPELVFEIAFEGIAVSNRHKSGIALRFPRILRWRKDKKADEINTLDDLKNLLHKYANPATDQDKFS